MNRKTTNWTSIIRCFLLLVLAWPGPKPIIHTHSRLAQSFAKYQSLDLHLAKYHSDSSTNPVSFDGLHVHWFISPGDESDCCTNPNSNRELKLDLGTGYFIDAEQLIGGMADQRIIAVQSACNHASTNAHLAIVHSHSRSHSGLSLHKAFCVMTC